MPAIVTTAGGLPGAGLSCHFADGPPGVRLFCHFDRSQQAGAEKSGSGYCVSRIHGQMSWLRYALPKIRSWAIRHPQGLRP
jgi:hypothetical protein